jgi:hypothetical protein
MRQKQKQLKKAATATTVCYCGETKRTCQCPEGVSPDDYVPSPEVKAAREQVNRRINVLLFRKFVDEHGYAAWEKLLREFTNES